MNFLKQSLIVIWIALSCCSYNGRNVPVIIKPLYPYQQEVVTGDLSDSINSINLKNRFYFIENYKGYEKDSLDFDKFIKEHIDSNYEKYADYHMIFYKKSKKTNESTTVDLKDFTERKPVLVYRWSKGNFEYCKDYFKNESGVIYPKQGNKIFNAVAQDTLYDSIQTEVNLEDPKK